MDTQTFVTQLSTVSSSRKDGMSAIFRKAEVPDTSGWLNPELSVGPYLGRNRWSRFKFWEAIGPARDAFHQMAPRIKQCLEDSVEPISSRVAWSMYMVGKAPSQASPSIIFCCEVSWYRRHIRDIINESRILDDYPSGIKTGHMRRLPKFDQLVRLGVADESLHKHGEFMAWTPHARSACGSQIFVSTRGTDSVSLSAVATIGGVILLGRSYYYTTAAHAILSAPDSEAGEEEPPASDDHGSTLSLGGDQSVCITSASNPSTDNLSGLHSPGKSAEYSDENRYLREDIVRQWSLKHSHEAEEPLSPLPDSGKLSLNYPLSLFMTSKDEESQATDLDYALIETTSRHHNVENVVKFGRRHGTIVKVHSFVKSVPGDTDIVAVTPRGTIRGLISGTPVYSSAPGQRAYNRMFKVSLGWPLRRGDCGTWVVDAANGRLFGHVVLGSPGGDTALIIPFSDIFDDILSRTGRSPMFPGTRRDDASSTSRSAMTRSPPTTREQALVQIVRKTIYSMSDLRQLASSKGDPISKPPSQAVTPLDSGSQIAEGVSHLPSARDDSEDLSKQTQPERKSGMKEVKVPTTHDTSITSRLAAHVETASQVDSDLNDISGEVSKGLGRPKELENVRSLQQKKKDRESSELDLKRDLGLPKDPTRHKSPEKSSRHRRHVPPVTLRVPKLQDVLLTFSKAPLQWENTELLDRALNEIDLNAIYTEAEDENARLISEARSKGHSIKPEWGFQDYLICSLLKYFRRSFFTRIKKPPCEACATKLPTKARGNARPTAEEKSGKAQVVELYQCVEKHCRAYTRFPRYWDVWTLLRNPRGRAGEAANCFGMLCRALGSRVRWVWNAEDSIWTEVYSEHQERWVHVDAYEGAWDDPLMYTQAIGKKLSYCVAFSWDGAADVTRRYVRDSTHALPRTRCSEPELLRVIHYIRGMRRRGMSKEDLSCLEKEDTAEALELESYVGQSDVTGNTGHSQPVEGRLTESESGIITSRTDSGERALPRYELLA